MISVRGDYRKSTRQPTEDLGAGVVDDPKVVEAVLVRRVLVICFQDPSEVSVLQQVVFLGVLQRECREYLEGGFAAGVETRSSDVGDFEKLVRGGYNRSGELQLDIGQQVRSPRAVVRPDVPQYAVDLNDVRYLRNTQTKLLSKDLRSFRRLTVLQISVLQIAELYSQLYEFSVSVLDCF